MTSTAVGDLVGRVLAGRYRLLVPIGTGASGRVFLADDVRLRRRVAVKVLHRGLADDRGFLRRFRAEAQMAAGLHHPHVVAVYDWGEDEGIPFMVLELLRGGSLQGMLDAGHRLSPAQAAYVGRQVAAALAYAHARGLVHRDVKPANLLFDEHGIVRVADFGLAQALAAASLTEPSGAVVGTARYAAPEQASGDALDGRADLYSLAVVLVEAVTGDVPVTGDTQLGTLALRAIRGLPAPTELGPLAPVLEEAGRPLPAQRYADAGAMGAALATVVRELPAPAPLQLPGLGDDADNAEPTRHGRLGASEDGGPSDRTQPLSDDTGLDAPLAIAVPPRRRSPLPLVAGLAVAVVLAGAAFAWFSGGSGASVAVPSLVGLSSTDAAARATDAGLLMKVVERRIADDPVGLVIEQHPTPGDFLGADDEIEVVVSRGPPPVVIPAIAGKPLGEAQPLLEQAGFVVSVVRRYDEQAPKDIALGTEPAGAAKAPRESTVKLIVSDGPAPVAVPTVAGQSYDAAAQALTAKRFSPVRRDDFSDTVAVGVVVGTDPAAGQLAPRDSQVTIIVSKGPEMVKVPNVVGETVESASQALAAVGLTPDVQNYGPGKRVRAQDPAAGTSVKKGSKVTLFL